VVENSFQIFNNAVQDRSSNKPSGLLEVLMWLNHVVSLNEQVMESQLVLNASNADLEQTIKAISVEKVSSHEAQARQKIRTILDNDPSEAVAIEALKLVSRLKDTDALDLVLTFLKDNDGNLDIQEQALKTLFAIDPNIENEKSREAILAFIRDSYISEYIKTFLFDEAYPDRFLWLKEFLESEYKDPQKDLEISDLEFLKVVSGLKPKIADFSDQLTEVFMFNQHDSYYKHAAIDVLNLYFPESGPIKKTVIDEYKAILEISPGVIEKSLIRKIENYTDEKKFPAWDTGGYLISDSLVLQKDQNLIRRCEISGSTMHFGKDQKPRCFENLGLDLSVDYFYNERGSLAAIKIKHQGCEYPFIVREGEQQHEHMDLYDYPDLKDSRKYPSMKLLASGKEAEKIFLYHDPQKITIFGDGRIQINEEGKIILLATNGSLLVSDDEHQGLKEFITTSGEYNYLEPVFN
jgi:hypothetical protein